ncbi:MAG: hypothetical protein ACRCY3_04415 [Sphingorhabdus sp.]
MIRSEWHAWHSGLFSGERVIMEFRMTGTDLDMKMERFANILPDTDFKLCQGFVAEIHLANLVKRKKEEIAFTIEALLLEE